MVTQHHPYIEPVAPISAKAENVAVERAYVLVRDGLRDKQRKYRLHKQYTKSHASGDRAESVLQQG